mmetsp:Transcript_17918/g.30501  ORF Transcript_17918/g.30501 Transcript_17918/m.30501 type:complete len:161 (-) Transcript_17918:246-728(-)
MNLDKLETIDTRMYSVLELRELVEYVELCLEEMRVDYEQGMLLENDLATAVNALKQQAIQPTPVDLQMMRLEERILELNDIIVELECETRVMRKLTKSTVRKMKMKAFGRVRSANTNFSDNSSISTKQSMELERAESTRTMSSGDTTLNSGAIPLGPAAA